MSLIYWLAGAAAVGFAGRALLGSAKAVGGSPPMVPTPPTKDFGVPFAPATGRIWPVVGGERSVPFTSPTGVVTGNSGTMFHASRESGLRWHAGVDLQAAPGQKIAAMEDGVVLGFVPGFVGLDTVVVQHPSVVAVYAEVTKALGLAVGAKVSAGQQIAVGTINKDGRSMLHLELWKTGNAPKGFVPWYQKDPPPRGLLDPTRYLLALAKAAL